MTIVKYERFSTEINTTIILICEREIFEQFTYVVLFCRSRDYPGVGASTHSHNIVENSSMNALMRNCTRF